MVSMVGAVRLVWREIWLKAIEKFWLGSVSTPAAILQRGDTITARVVGSHPLPMPRFYHQLLTQNKVEKHHLAYPAEWLLSARSHQHERFHLQ